MKNAHLRFGWLTYVKSTEKTTTSIRLRLDRFIGEVVPDPPRQAKAHLISVIGGDTQVAAVSAAVSLGDRFMVEGPGVQPIRVCLERNAQCFKGSIQLAGRKRPLRHLIALSEEFASSSISESSGRTLPASSKNGFIWASIAHILGIPGMPRTRILPCRNASIGASRPLAISIHVAGRVISSTLGLLSERVLIFCWPAPSFTLTYDFFSPASSSRT
jgi:hypothetical protein